MQGPDNTDLLRSIFGAAMKSATPPRATVTQHYKLVETLHEGSVFVFHGSAPEALSQILAAKRQRDADKRAANSPHPRAKPPGPKA